VNFSFAFSGLQLRQEPSTMPTTVHIRVQVLKIYGPSRGPVKKQSQSASNLQKK